MAVSLTLANNDDSTATATISGADPAAAIAVYVARWTGQIGAVTYAIAGTRTGNGTLLLSTGVGWWLAYATSNLAGVLTLSGGAYAEVTDAATSFASPHLALLDAVRVRLLDLIAASTLVGIAPESVRVRWLPSALDFGADTDKSYALPGVLVVPGGAESSEAASNTRDLIGYPVVIAVFDRPAELDAETRPSRLLAWRRVIRNEFKHRSLTASGYTFHDCRWEPAPVIDWGVYVTRGVQVSAGTLRFFAPETRGN